MELSSPRCGDVGWGGDNLSCFIFFSRGVHYEMQLHCGALEIFMMQILHLLYSGQLIIR